ncbi:MAG: hypothetical protein FVQ82_17700 [Planctomycetes bacterium]|nr:hypothetical protein [Planctomycetota bacterium]
MLCTQVSLVQQHEFHTVIVPLYCNTWSCDICAPRRRRRLVREAAEGAPNRLITLTVRAGDVAGQVSRARDLVRAWRTLRALYLRRHGKGSLEFLAVFERTRRGEPHLHILCRSGYVNQRWLSAQMARLIGAPIVDVRAIHGSRHAARYVGKYVAKGLGVFAGCKRYWRSLGYLEPSLLEERRSADEYEPPWRMVLTPWRDLALNLAPASWSILWGRDIATVHFPKPP